MPFIHKAVLKVKGRLSTPEAKRAAFKANVLQLIQDNQLLLPKHGDTLEKILKECNAGTLDPEISEKASKIPEFRKMRAEALSFPFLGRILDKDIILEMNRSEEYFLKKHEAIDLSVQTQLDLEKGQYLDVQKAVYARKKREYQEMLPRLIEVDRKLDRTIPRQYSAIIEAFGYQTRRGDLVILADGLKGLYGSRDNIDAIIERTRATIRKHGAQCKEDGNGKRVHGQGECICFDYDTAGKKL